jgi:hypothetical protein
MCERAYREHVRGLSLPSFLGRIAVSELEVGRQLAEHNIDHHVLVVIGLE